MSAAALSPASLTTAASPFSRRVVIAMVAVGMVAFVALLYGLGAGASLSSGRNGEAHGASNSIVGYQALARLLERSGYDVRYGRSEAAFDDPGLLIVTPNPFTEPEDIDQLHVDRSYAGATMLVVPKWFVATGVEAARPIKPGWAVRSGRITADVGEELVSAVAEASLSLQGGEPEPGAAPPRSGARASFALGPPVPVPPAPVTIDGDIIGAIAREPESGEALIAYLDDGGIYAELGALDPPQFVSDDEDADPEGYAPFVLVADADLMNNYGMSNRATARAALTLVDALVGDARSEDDKRGPVNFDLTYNGLGGSDNLLTLAFRPPLLGVTVCLIAAALAAAWMALNRFGPARGEQRSVAFGKAALVENSAGLLARSGRQHLVAAPYLALIRSRAARALGLEKDLDDAELDRRLDARSNDGFTPLAGALASAQTPADTARAAAALHQWYRKLTE